MCIYHNGILQSDYEDIRPSDPVVEWVTCLPGTPLTWVQSQVGMMHSDSDDHYNGGPVLVDPQWHIKQPWKR